MAPRTYESAGWIILLIVSVIFALFGLGDILLATGADPAIVQGYYRADPRRAGGHQPGGVEAR